MPVICELRDDIKEYLEARKLFKKWEKAKKLFEQNPEYPSLHTELMEPRHRRCGALEPEGFQAERICMKFGNTLR